MWCRCGNVDGAFSKLPGLLPVFPSQTHQPTASSWCVCKLASKEPTRSHPECCFSASRNRSPLHRGETHRRWSSSHGETKSSSWDLNREPLRCEESVNHKALICPAGIILSLKSHLKQTVYGTKSRFEAAGMIVITRKFFWGRNSHFTWKTSWSVWTSWIRQNWKV